MVPLSSRWWLSERLVEDMVIDDGDSGEKEFKFVDELAGQELLYIHVE